VEGLLQLIDRRLEHSAAAGMNMHPGIVPSDMTIGRTSDDWTVWEPIGSTVADAQIEDLEGSFGVPFSPQYIGFLKHKHFIELTIGEVSLFAHPSEGWMASLRRQVLDGWPREYLLDVGLLPFADFSDWGLLCFGTLERTASGEYPVYLWDHDRPQSRERKADCLESALVAEDLRQVGS
jgi:hypothetical protein